MFYRPSYGEEYGVEMNSICTILKTRSNIIALFVMLFIILLCSGCAVGEDAVAKVKPSIVSIKADSKSGSGVIYKNEGYIITNKRIVDGAEKISVTLSGNNTLNAELIGMDETADLAIIKVESEKSLTAATFAPSGKSNENDDISTVGLTNNEVKDRKGVIRKFETQQNDDNTIKYILTDAVINEGNSGGALIDTDGDVVGINVLGAKINNKDTEKGTYIAIAADSAKEIADKIIGNPNGEGSSSGGKSSSNRDRLEASVIYIKAAAERNSREYSLGSGFIYTEDGYVVTNSHVVHEHNNIIKVFLPDRSEFNARLVDEDVSVDLAILKIYGEQKFPTPKIGNSDKVKREDTVKALGSPLDEQLANTTTTGTISGLNRKFKTGSGTTVNAIQIDASIDHGNSGGPLANKNYEVIGINTWGIDGANNKGFAIPFNPMKEKADVMIAKDKKRPYLGVILRDKEDRSSLDVSGLDGIWVYQVISGSPADKAGIADGDNEFDVIRGINGANVNKVSALRQQLDTFKEGDVITLNVVRYVKNGKKWNTNPRTIKVTLEKKPLQDDNYEL